MTERDKDNLFYVCSLIEYIGRKTHNRRGMIVNAIKEEGINKQLYDAEVNHCLPFEQVSDEIIDRYKISMGDFDTLADCKYSIPSFMDIGRLYSILILECTENEVSSELMKIFNSFISDEISDFKTGVYFENPSYLKCSYEAGYLLD